MFTTLRKHQRWLMTVIAVLTVVAFAWLYNTTDLERVGTNIVARVYGRDVMQVDVERALRNYQLALALGQFDLVRDLSGMARSEQEGAENFIWNLMVLQHESLRLGIEPARELIVNRIKSLPVFQTEGQFDPLVYAEFTQQRLAPNGFTERQLESVIRDSLRLEGIKTLVQAPAVVQPAELEKALERTRPFDLEILTWDAVQSAKKVEISEEELQTAFAARTSTLSAPEKRSVRYVAFAMTDDEKKLMGKERLSALQRVATAAGDFAQKLADDAASSLESVATSLGLEVGTTPKFANSGTPDAAVEGVSSDVVAASAPVAFRLPAGQYEIVALGEAGYAVIEVAEVSESRPLSFDEAKADLRAALIAAKREQVVREAADAALSKIKAELSDGKSIEQAAKAAGVKVSSAKGLSVFNQELSPQDRQRLAAAMDLNTGELGSFVPTPDGGFAVYVAGRGNLDEATLARQKPMIEGSLRQGQEMLLFAQWLGTARQSADVQILRPAL
jgi:hypothetical protein